MAIAYDTAPKDVLDLFKSVIERYHPEKAKVRVGILMVTSVDKEGNPDGGWPLKWSGYAASAKVKIVPMRDRIFKNIDVEIHLDAHTWRAINEQQQTSILDHEMEHVMIMEDPEEEGDTEAKLKLKLKPDDYCIWGFEAIARRHGANSMEVMSARRLRESIGKVLFDDYQKAMESTRLASLVNQEERTARPDDEEAAP